MINKVSKKWYEAFLGFLDKHKWCRRVFFGALMLGFIAVALGVMVNLMVDSWLANLLKSFLK